MNFRSLVIVVTFLLISNSYKGFAQCPFDPVVSGDTLLCPNATGQLTTQTYDTYQWYKRPLFGGPSQPVPGAISQTLIIDAANDAGYYFKVEATLNGCTEMSPEVLVDSWVFLLPYTIIEGDYTIGSNGELILCQGDSILLICGLPYDTNLQWYDNGSAIAGANNDTLIVTTAGSYTFSGAPAVCPSFNQNQFIPSDVVIINCPTGLSESPGYEVGISPNPGSDLVSVSFAGCEKIDLYDSSGLLMLTTITTPSAILHTIDISKLNQGTYILCVSKKGQTKAALLFKK